MKFLVWVKENRLLSVLTLVILYLLFSRRISTFFYNVKYSNRLGSGDSGLYTDTFPRKNPGLGIQGYSGGLPPSARESMDISRQDRRVVEDANVSLLVEDVPKSLGAIKSEATSLGGFLVESSFSKPEESAFGSISVRVPRDKKENMLSFLRKSAVKVVSESVRGRDITDQYIDINARKETLLKTKGKFESLLDKAVSINDILSIQREIISIQEQTDSLVGQEKRLEQMSESVRITAHLSTDEYSLPYTPDTNWRPRVIFKQAVRSVVSTMRDFGSLLIWAGVYSIIWLPLLVIVVVVKKRIPGKLK